MSRRAARILLRLYPRVWRDHYGAEYTELLAMTALTLSSVVDVARHASVEHGRAHRRGSRAVASLACFAVLDALAVHAGITDNILWAPRTPVRAVALALTVAPLVSVLADGMRGRSARA